MPLPNLPVEVHSEILKHIPTTGDTGIKILLTFQQCNTLLQAAALAPEVWEPHYRTRYMHFVESNELERRIVTGGNWRELYIQRRRLDQTALRLLDEIRKDPRDRLQKGSFIADLSFDVWDALRLESKIPIPNCFQRAGQGDDGVPKDALPRRFWSNVLLGVIARRQTIGLWHRAFRRNEEITFEVALASLSSMFDVSIKEVIVMLDDIFEQCKQGLHDAEICLDPTSRSYDVWDVCTEIRSVLRDMGFHQANSNRFHRIIAQFPHSFLQAGQRDAIPMSLVYVFVTICQRLGIDAYPINSPGAVLARVCTPSGDRIIDMRSAKRPVLPEQALELLPQIPLFELPPGEIRIFNPARSVSMLNRAFDNLLNSIQFERAYDEDHQSFDRRETAYYTVILGREFDREGHLDFILPLPPVAKAFDCQLVLRDTLCPLLPEHRRGVVDRVCAMRVDDEESAVVRVRKRGLDTIGVLYFVGLVFRHAHLHYVGCIYGWDPTCQADENWIAEMQVDKLEYGRNQPFYKAFTNDARTRYIAQENIRFIKPGRALDEIVKLYESNSVFGRYFSDVSEDGCRLLVTDETRYRYPDDEEYGKAWVQGKPEQELVSSNICMRNWAESVPTRMFPA